MDGGQEGEPQPETEDRPETQDEPNNDQDSDNDNEALPTHTYKEHKFVFKDFERVCYCDLQGVCELTKSALSITNFDYFSFI